MNQNVQTLMLTRFATLYGAPTSPNPQAAIDEYDKALKGFCVEALKHGADKVISENTFRAWPTVGECVKACRDYRAPRTWGNGESVADILPPGGQSARSDEEREAHIAETRRMIDALKAQVANSPNIIGREKRRSGGRP